LPLCHDCNRIRNAVPGGNALNVAALSCNSPVDLKANICR
jgi:hypothetical protein